MDTWTFTRRKVKTDAKMKFYTGINTIVLFNEVFRLVQPFSSDIIYWKRPKYEKNFSKVKHRRCNTPKKLSQRDEFLLTLMRLRLGLLNEDLAERFGVLPTLSLYVFTTWIRLLSKVLGKVLVVWPPKESIGKHLPEIFLKSGYGKCCVIIDCAEMFSESPKLISAQAATWSGYRHHNTFKFLVGITPTRFISFLSSWGSSKWQVYHQKYWVLWFIGKWLWSSGRQGFSNSRGFASSFLQIGCSTRSWEKSQMTKSEFK